MGQLSLKSGPYGTWYPRSVAELTSLLQNAILSGQGYPHVYALRRNIAYSLQYVEFLDRCLQDLKLSSVIATQTWKNAIVVGCSVMESLLNYLLIAKGVHATTDWQVKDVMVSNPKAINGTETKVETHIFARLPKPQPIEMTFDAMLKKAESHKVLGSNHSLYAALKKLRPLRNPVHLQQIGHATDTDWNAFQYEDMRIMARVLHATFTSSIFSPSTDERRYFDYLRKYL